MANPDYIKPYQDYAKKHGSDFGATLWANPKTQQRRFEVFTQMAFLAGKRVLDAGSSRGDFAQFLIDHEIPFENYTGIDAVEEIIVFATQRRLDRCEFHLGDFVADPSLLAIGNPQIITLSGSLNTMSDKQATDVLQSAWHAASETLIFNFLSDRAGPNAAPQLGPARRLNTLNLLDWALSQTWAVTLRHDYFPNGHDATIMMTKTP